MGSSVSIVPWKGGQLLVWDATCPGTFAPFYSTIAAKQVGAVAQQAEDKIQKYQHLDSCYFFTPVAIETSGVFGPKTMEFLKELGRPEKLTPLHISLRDSQLRPTWQRSV